MSEIDTLTTQKPAGAPQTINGETTKPSSLTETDTSPKNQLSNLFKGLPDFKGIFKNKVVMFVITGIVIFFLLKFTIFR